MPRKALTGVQGANVIGEGAVPLLVNVTQVLAQRIEAYRAQSVAADDAFSAVVAAALTEVHNALADEINALFQKSQRPEKP